MTYTMNNTELEALGFKVEYRWLLSYTARDDVFAQEQYKEFVGTLEEAEDELIWYEEHGFDTVMECLDEDLEETCNEVKAEYDAEQAEELDAGFETYMLNKYGPSWQEDIWFDVDADRELYDWEVQREFDLYINEMNREWA